MCGLGCDEVKLGLDPLGGGRGDLEQARSGEMYSPEWSPSGHYKEAKYIYITKFMGAL